MDVWTALASAERLPRTPGVVRGLAVPVVEPRPGLRTALRSGHW